MVELNSFNPFIATEKFRALNSERVSLKEHTYYGYCIITDTPPKELNYPEGWFYENGFFNHTSCCQYGRIPMVTSKNEFWGDKVN